LIALFKENFWLGYPAYHQETARASVGELVAHLLLTDENIGLYLGKESKLTHAFFVAEIRNYSLVVCSLHDGTI
jgi:hypothetical protein